MQLVMNALLSWMVWMTQWPLGIKLHDPLGRVLLDLALKLEDLSREGTCHLPSPTCDAKC